MRAVPKGLVIGECSGTRKGLFQYLAGVTVR